MRCKYRIPPTGPSNMIQRTPYPFSPHPTGWERVAMIVTYGVFASLVVALIALAVMLVGGGR